MQEKRRLQQPGHHVRPVDDPVKVVELAGVVERVKDERHQAEHIEVSALGSGPAAQQDVQSNAEVDKCDQPQTAIQRSISRSQNQWGFDGNFLAYQRVGGLGPDTGAIQLPLQATYVANVTAIHRNQQGSFLDAGLFARAVDVHPLCAQVSALFHPPHAVVRGEVLAVLLEVNPSENDGRYAK